MRRIDSAEAIAAPASVEAWTPSDSLDLAPPARAIYVGASGDVRIDDLAGHTTVLKALQAGTFHPVRAKRIYATGTTATDIVVAR